MLFTCSRDFEQGLKTLASFLISQGRAGGREGTGTSTRGGIRAGGMGGVGLVCCHLLVLGPWTRCLIESPVFSSVGRDGNFMFIQENSLRNTMTGRAKMIAVSGALPEKTRRWGNWVADGQGTWGCLHLHIMTEAGQQWGLRLASCQNTGTWPFCVVSQPGRVWASSEHGT